MFFLPNGTHFCFGLNVLNTLCIYHGNDYPFTFIAKQTFIYYVLLVQWPVNMEMPIN